jgi:hypothetical protein
VPWAGLVGNVADARRIEALVTVVALDYPQVGSQRTEFGGPFGGEKDTGDGRESDSWKACLRRATNVVDNLQACRWRRVSSLMSIRMGRLG